MLIAGRAVLWSIHGHPNYTSFPDNHRAPKQRLIGRIRLHFEFGDARKASLNLVTERSRTVCNTHVFAELEQALVYRPVLEIENSPVVDTRLLISKL